MKNILVCFGTRPEIIKMAPLIIELKRNGLRTSVLHTGQHDDLANQMLNIFDINPDFNLDVMSETNDLFSLTSVLLPKLKETLNQVKPDAVFVQGDTSSAYLSALAAFYLRIPVYHLEAGLRSFDMMNPFPEEMNRKQISALAVHHFAPTKIAFDNLINEGFEGSSITLSGNTVIDSLESIRRSDQFLKVKPPILNQVSNDKKLILVTAHRRENHGTPLSNILSALKKIEEKVPDVMIVFPAHPSPVVQKEVVRNENIRDRIKIIAPLNYLEFQHVLSRADIILTDSGGIQEEAAALGKKMLVLRDTTERQELILSGFTKLVGSDTDKIVSETLELLEDSSSNAGIKNPYGDGNAAEKIVSTMKQLLEA